VYFPEPCADERSRSSREREVSPLREERAVFLTKEVEKKTTCGLNEGENREVDRILNPQHTAISERGTSIEVAKGVFPHGSEAKEGDSAGRKKELFPHEQ